MTDKERIKAYVISIEKGKYIKDIKHTYLGLTTKLHEAIIRESEDEIKLVIDKVVKDYSVPRGMLEIVPITIQESNSNDAVEVLEKLKQDIWTDQIDNGYIDDQVDLYTLTDAIDNLIKEYGGKDE